MGLGSSDNGKVAGPGGGALIKGTSVPVKETPESSRPLPPHKDTVRRGQPVHQEEGPY